MKRTLISTKQRIRLLESLHHELCRFHNEKFGKFTFMEFLDFTTEIRKNYTAMFSTEKHKNRIPHYIWDEFRGATEIMLRLLDKHVEGGYLVFGKIYGHGGRNSYLILNWKDDLCPDDPSFRQKLLGSKNYVQVWKDTKNIYSDGYYSEPKPEFPAMAFYTETPKVLRFNINFGDGNTTTGTEPFSTKTSKYKKVLNIMETYNIEMCNVTEL